MPDHASIPRSPEGVCHEDGHQWVSMLGVAHCHRCHLPARELDAIPTVSELEAWVDGPAIRVDGEGNTWTVHHEPSIRIEDQQGAPRKAGPPARCVHPRAEARSEPPSGPQTSLGPVSAHHRLASLAAVWACVWRGFRRRVG